MIFDKRNEIMKLKNHNFILIVNDTINFINIYNNYYYK